MNTIKDSTKKSKRLNKLLCTLVTTVRNGVLYGHTYAGWGESRHTLIGKGGCDFLFLFVTFF